MAPSRGGQLRPWQADLFAVAATGATFALRFALDGPLEGEPTLVLFTLPIMASGYLGGLRAGLVATALVYLGASYYLLPPIGSFAVASGAERWQQFFVALTGIVISGLNEALHLARRRLQRQEVEINRVSRLYAALNQVNQAIVWTTHRDELFRKICAVLVEHGGFHMAWIGWLDPATRSISAVATAGEAGDFFHDLKIFVSRRAGSDGPVETAFREQRPCISNDVLADPAARAWHAQLERLGIRAVAVLPIREKGEVVGMIVVYAGVPDFFQDKEIALLAGAAVDVSFALDNFVRDAERQQAEQNLRTSEDRLRAYVEQAADYLFEHDSAGRFLDVNPQACANLGYTREELLRMNLFEVEIDFDLPRAQAAWSQMAPGQPFTLEGRQRRRDGSVFHVEARLGCYDRAGQRTFLALVRDITERKEAAERLQRSEASLANAQHIARVGNWDFDIASSALTWSAEVYRIFGVDPATFEVSYETFMALVHPEDRGRVEAAHEAAAAGRARQDFEHRLVRPDGTVRVVHELADVTGDRAGPPTQLSGTVQDITERVQGEAKLRESEEAFSAAFRASPMAMAITTLEGRYVEANEAFARLLGVPREEIIGRTATGMGVLTPGTRSQLIRDIELAGDTSSGMEFEIRHRDGTLRTVVAGAAEITLRGARHRLATAMDVTEHRRSERAFRESELRYRRLFESAKDGILILDAETGSVDDVNPFLLDLLGFSRDEVLGKPVWELGFLSDVVENHEKFTALKAQDHVRYDHLPLETRTGQAIEVEFVSNAYLVNGSRVMQCNVRDVTARRRAEEELRQLNITLERRVAERTAQLEGANRELAKHASAVSHDLRVAEAADRLKSTFLATMSHELRTPLNSIIGFTGIVLAGKAGPLNAEQTKQLGMVRGSARHLLELINDVLDLSKIEAGQFAVRAEPFDLRTSIYRVMASVAPQTENKPLSLTTNLPPELGGMVSDRRRVEQILLNLVNNAIKFTERGDVTLTVALLAGPRPSVRFQVADTGVGVAPEDLATLFQPFRQLDSGLARQSEGTGLGLAISSRLATLLGGEISAVSEPARGSTFTVTLPLQKIP